MAQTLSKPGGSQRPDPIRKRPKALPFPLSLGQTAIGKKWLMALTGVGLLGFVFAHMVGNLHVYEGPARVAEYAETLRTLGGGLAPRGFVLWIMRLGLIAMFGVHIWAAYTLKEMSRKSSTKANWMDGSKTYPGGRDYIAANFASRTMRWTGPIIMLYVLFHLADLTWGRTLGDNFVHGDPYHNLDASFNRIPVLIIYIVANIALAIHIFHGAWSMFQSLGINNPKYNAARRAFAVGFAGLILVGNLSFPILNAAGLTDEDERQCDPKDENVLECLELQLVKEGHG
ncbi:MAG: succinate dehydrogenase cytochrome b subunit [Acidimicrobiales bacterium]